MDESDVLSLAKLKSLRGNPEVLASLSNPHLRQLLQEIDSAPNPTQALKEAMSIPIFIEFADACLATCGLDIVDKPR
eukprot:m.238163 g.238163  ORF g.238163 m.238163 type:complete len:77 (-) comp13259_c0_seq1:145-375(-)